MNIRTFLGIDYGLKRVGVAVGNTLTGNAEPLSIIQRKDDEQVIKAIQQLIREWQISTLIVGVPRHPDGTAHEMTAQCLNFIAQLRAAFGIAVVEVDERYTSAVTTTKTTRKANGQVRSVAQDDQAAAIILKQYLNDL